MKIVKAIAASLLIGFAIWVVAVRVFDDDLFNTSAWKQTTVDSGQTVELVGLRGQIAGLQELVVRQGVELAELKSEQKDQAALIWHALTQRLDADMLLFTLITNNARNAQLQINQINQARRTATR